MFKLFGGALGAEGIDRRQARRAARREERQASRMARRGLKYAQKQSARSMRQQNLQSVLGFGETYLKSDTSAYAGPLGAGIATGEGASSLTPPASNPNLIIPIAIVALLLLRKKK